MFEAGTIFKGDRNRKNGERKKVAESIGHGA